MLFCALLLIHRELRNKETRLDLSVPDYHEVPGLLSNEEVFHVIVITSLPYFKTISHKKQDTVQFMVGIAGQCPQLGWNKAAIASHCKSNGKLIAALLYNKSALFQEYRTQETGHGAIYGR